MKILAIIQARMSSRRLPGKVLRQVNSKPLLQYILDSLVHCPRLIPVVATSVEESDTPIADYCNQNGVSCHRGSLNDVAGRFMEALEEYNADAFVRICGDSPWMSPNLVNHCLQVFLDGTYDMVTNIKERTFPKGLSVEVINRKVFEQAYPLMTEPGDLEHVTPYFYRNSRHYNIHNIYFEEDCSSLQLSVDNPEDLENFTQMLGNMTKPHWQYTVKELIALYRRLAK